MTLPDTCRICGNAHGNVRYRAREMLLGTRDEFDYFQCGECCCLQIADVPSELARYYPADYYAFGPVDWTAPSHLALALRRARTRHLLGGRGLLGALLTRLTGPADLPQYVLPARLRIEDRILDVGCGSGSLLRALAEQGFQRLIGVDPFIAGDVTAPNGVTLRRAELADVRGEFDAIILNHAFEHMPDPHGTFRLLAERLAPAGVIVLRIPVVPSVAWETYGVDWLQLDAPRHLFLHSRDSIGRLAAAHGLRIDDVVYDSDARQFWGSEQYRRDVPHLSERSYKVNPAASAFAQDDLREYEERARVLNREGRGDQASFYIRRQQVALAGPAADDTAAA